MQIRLARSDDATAISGLVSALTAKYIAHEFTPDGAQHLLGSMTPESIASYIDSGFRYHLAEEGEFLAGVVGTRDNSHLYHLFVAEPFQRQGLATQLWEVARQACLAAGGAGAFTVNSSRCAVRFYKQLGFVEAGPCIEQSGVVCTPMKYERRRP